MAGAGGWRAKSLARRSHRTPSTLPRLQGTSPVNLRNLTTTTSDTQKKKRGLRSLRGCSQNHSQERDLRFAWLVAHDAGRRIDNEPHLISLNVDAANADDGQDMSPLQVRNG